MYEISLGKESFKFSSSHFTVFDENRAERLHGHNYYVTAFFEFPAVDENEMACEFHLLKKEVQRLCDELDEFVLLPQNSPHVKIEEDGRNIQAIFAEKHYSFPKDDVRLLPLKNITCEALARYLAESLKVSSAKTITVEVEETRGQAVRFKAEGR